MDHLRIVSRKEFDKVGKDYGRQDHRGAFDATHRKKEVNREKCVLESPRPQGRSTKRTKKTKVKKNAEKEKDAKEQDGSSMMMKMARDGWSTSSREK